LSKRMDWFRLYSEIRRDPKIRRLTPEERWLWVAVLCIASDSPKRGYLLISDDFPYEAIDIADEAALPVDVTEKGLDKLIRFGLLERDENGTYYVPKWDERQYDNPSDTPEATRERKRRSRERKKSEQDASRVSHDNVTSNENETSRQCHEQVTRCHDLDTDTEADTDPEINISSASTTARTCEKSEPRKSYLTAHEEAFGFSPTPAQIQVLNTYLDDGMDEQVVIRAIERAAVSGTGYSFNLIRKILNDYMSVGALTLDKAIAFDNEFERRRRTMNVKPSRAGPRADSEIDYNALSL